MSHNPINFDLASVQSAWQGLNKLVPLGPITSEAPERQPA